MSYIEWKRIDKDNPPEGKYLFYLDDDIYTGWVIESEVDDEGYPLWETSEAPTKTCGNVRFYASYNRPKDMQK